MEKLEDITRLSEHVVRILGQNPGKFTLQGTNTYLIGTSNPYILIDTAEGLPSYLPHLASALSQGRTDPSKPDVSDIILSHWHHDHVGGLPSVLSLLKDLWDTRNPSASSSQSYTPPRLHKHPIEGGTNGGHATSYNQLPSILSNLPADLYTPPPATNSNTILHDLADGQTLSSQGVPLLRVLHTPGHTADSICMYVPADRALYTADTVLGHGTAVFEDLALYLSSLNKMLHFGSSGPNPSTGKEDNENEIDLEYTTLYPAHGAPVSEGRETISTYIRHRLEREAQVLAVLRSSVPAHLLADDVTNLKPIAEAQNEAEVEGESTSTWTTWNIVRVIYQSYPENLWLPAARGIDLHLRKLEGEGVIRRVGDAGGEAQHTQWSIVTIAPRSPSL